MTTEPEREPVETGEHYTFYSTARTCVASNGDPLYLYSGRRLLVIGRIDIDPDEGVEPMFLVNVGNGVTFDAYEGELNGYYHDTGQFYGPGGKWGEL